MIMTFHIYWPRRFHRTWFGVNRPSGCWVPVSARFQGPLPCTWAGPLWPHGQMTMTPYICRTRRFQRAWLGVNRPCGCRFPASKRVRVPFFHAHGHAHYALMGKWRKRWTSTGRDDSKELNLVWIGPVVADFRHHQDSRGLYDAHGHALCAPMGKWSRRCTSTGRWGSHALDLEWTGPVVVEIRRPQDSRSYHTHGHAHYAAMGKYSGERRTSLENLISAAKKQAAPHTCFFFVVSFI